MSDGMRGFVRPELRARLWRWREVLAGAGLFCFGLWAALGPGGLLGALGWIAAALGGGVAVMGLQRGRFRAPRGQGPGSVDVDEGQVTYFGPLTGGMVALSDLTELALIRAGQSPHWRLSAGAEQIFIPVDAAGADALFDAFSVLPGLRMEHVLTALDQEDGGDSILWRRGGHPGPEDRPSVASVRRLN